MLIMMLVMVIVVIVMVIVVVMVINEVLGLSPAFWIVLLELFLGSFSDLGRSDGGERGVRRVLVEERLEHFAELVFLCSQWKDTEEYNNLRARVRLGLA